VALPLADQKADAHPPGAKGNLVVAEGGLAMIFRGKRYELSAGDAIAFEADWPHEYRNEGPDALRMFLVHEVPGHGKLSGRRERRSPI
jgi:mannose-6-phosphate isomerase-like protein (cupin superfamily)